MAEQKSDRLEALIQANRIVDEKAHDLEKVIQSYFAIPTESYEEVADPTHQQRRVSHSKKAA
jgi:predicted P-loop ATPase/GTPase